MGKVHQVGAMIFAYTEWGSLLARFNAIPPSSIDVESLVNEDWAAFLISRKIETEFDGVIRYAADSLIGDELVACCQANESKIRSLANFTRSRHAVVSDMPKALSNNDVQSSQSNWAVYSRLNTA